MYSVAIFLMFIFLILKTTVVVALPEGAPCTDKSSLDGDRPGTCKQLFQCPYAEALVRIEEKKPTHCGWVGASNHEIVCCPNEDVSNTLGEFRDQFRSAHDGIMLAKDMKCRYKGEEPIVCCGTNPDPPLTKEPETCPPLPTPKSPKDRNDLIWKKCVEYQRYLYECVSSPTDKNKYTRNMACAQSGFFDKISSGEPANKTEFPHMALLGCRYQGEIRWVGGGSLVSEKFILTAAHVVVHPTWNILRYALLGTTTKNVREGILYNIIKHHVHDLYAGKYHDIALLELDRSATMSTFIRPICLPMNNVKIGVERVVTGWGRVGDNLNTSQNLLKAGLAVLDKSHCIKTLDLQTLRYGWNDSIMICAGNGDSGGDSCEGDSGGPLQAYMDELSCTYVILGIVSNGPTCGQGRPAIYVRVEAYLDWIVETIWPGQR